MFRNKVSDLAAGHVSRDGLWEKYIWSDFRGGILSGLAGESLRSVIVVGGWFSPFILELGGDLFAKADGERRCTDI